MVSQQDYKHGQHFIDIVEICRQLPGDSQQKCMRGAAPHSTQRTVTRHGKKQSSHRTTCTLTRLILATIQLRVYFA